MKARMTIVAVLGLLVLCSSTLNADLGLISHWQFDEGSGATAHDSAGTNDGIINGATWTTGKIDDALSFDGMNDYVLIPNSPELNPTDITVSAWIKMYRYPSVGEFIVWKWTGSWQYTSEYSIQTYIDGKAYFGLSKENVTNLSVGSKEPLSLGQWYHLAGTYDIATQQMKFYTDGIFQESKSWSYGIQASTEPLRIGSQFNVYYFNGLIDEVRIYNRALSEEEIQQLYQGVKVFAPYPADGATCVDPNVALGWSEGKGALSHDVYLGIDYNDVNDATPDSNEYMGNYDANSYDPCGLEIGTTYYWRIDKVAGSNTYKGDVWSFTTWIEHGLISLWKFDEGEGTIAYDSAGTNDGTLVNGPTWTTGILNGALSFDGVDDYVRVPDDYSLDLGTHDLSFAFWFRTNESSVGTMLGKRSTTTGPFNRVADGYSTALLADGTVNIHFRHSASSDSDVFSTSTASYNDGNWHHLAGVYTRSANIELYVDGVPEGIPGDISYAEGADIDLTQPLAIGCRVLYGVSNQFHFIGLIDDVRLYDRALSKEDISEVYRSGWCKEGYPCINVWPKILDFQADEGGPNPAPQILSISNFGDGILNYQIIENCPWLEVDPNSGSSTGEPNEVTISVDISGLTCGFYECDLIVSDANASNNPQIVHVRLEVFREDCHVDVRVVPVVVLIDPASTSEVRNTLPDSMPGVVQGNTYYIEIWASDVGKTNTGLIGVYVDVDFCEQTSASAVEHGTIFVTFPDGTIQPGGVDEFGGSALPSGGGIEPKWVRVGWIQMSAGVNPGTCTVSLSPSSTGIGALERGVIPWAFVDLGSVELQITPPVRSYDLDGDDFIGLADLSFFAGSWQQHVPPANEEHDFDCDNSVGVGDLSWFATGWQKDTDDTTILYPPCLEGGAGALILNNSVPGMRSSNTFQTSFSSDMSEPSTDIAFGLAVLDFPSSSDISSILPTSIKKISAGQTYYLEVWVSDTGYINTGLTSAYVDLSFPDDAASVVNISHSDIFAMFISGSGVSGKIDELGGSTVDGVGIEPEWARVAAVQMHANATLPAVTFTLSPSSMGVAAWGRGSIDWSDVSLGSLMICPADFDNDADVDMTDLSIFASAYRTRPGEPLWNPDCDIFKSAEDIIDTLDLAVFVDAWLIGTEP